MYPNVRVESQNETEEVILVLRAHPFTQISWVVNTFGLITLLIIGNYFLPLVLSANQILFVDVFGLFVVFTYAFFNFLTWFFNVGVVTNERIIDIDYRSLVYKEVTEARLEKVEDVTSKMGGFFESIFNYGNVFVQTAGTTTNIEFINVPRPAQVVKIINDLTQ